MPLLDEHVGKVKRTQVLRVSTFNLFALPQSSARLMLPLRCYHLENHAHQQRQCHHGHHHDRSTVLNVNGHDVDD